MSNRSARPKWIKGQKMESLNESKSNAMPMNFKKGNARKPRPNNT